MVERRPIDPCSLTRSPFLIPLEAVAMKPSLRSMLPRIHSQFHRLFPPPGAPRARAGSLPWKLSAQNRRRRAGVRRDDGLCVEDVGSARDRRASGADSGHVEIRFALGGAGAPRVLELYPRVDPAFGLQASARPGRADRAGLDGVDAQSQPAPSVQEVQQAHRRRGRDLELHDRGGGRVLPGAGAQGGGRGMERFASDAANRAAGRRSGLPDGPRVSGARTA